MILDFLMSRILTILNLHPCMMCVHVNGIQPWDEVIVMLYKDKRNSSCNMEIRRESDDNDNTASFNCKD